MHVPAFEAAFACAESFRTGTGVYPFVLTSALAPWRRLHEALAAELRKAGLGGAAKGEFQPLITLAYDKLRITPFGVPPSASMVRDFVLIHSQLGKTAHTHLGRWPLA